MAFDPRGTAHASLGAQPSPQRKSPNLNTPHDFPHLKKTLKSAKNFGN